MLRRHSPPRDTLRVVHLVAPGPVGGLESVVRRLVTGQRSHGIDATVCAVLDLDRTRHPFVASLEQAQVPVAEIPLPPRAYLREYRELRGVLTDLAPDVVHCHGARPDVIGGRAAQGLGIPTATTVHGFTGGDLKNRLYEWLQRQAHRRFDAVVSVSAPLADRLAARGIERGRLHLIRNAWQSRAPAWSRESARQRLGVPLEATVIGWVGRLGAEKGLDVLFRALPLVDRAQVGLPLVAVLGEGRERWTLGALASELGIERQVRWCGTVLEAAALFTAFDAFVLSSRTEGTPMVLFESMGAGVPIVATAVGGVPDVVGPEEAWLVPSEAPQALAQAITSALADTPEATRRAARARERLETEFAEGPWIERYTALYRQLLTQQKQS